MTISSAECREAMNTDPLEMLIFIAKNNLYKHLSVLNSVPSFKMSFLLDCTSNPP